MTVSSRCPHKLQKPSINHPLVLLMWSRALRRLSMGVLHVGVDVGAGDAEVDVIYISFIVSVQYIGH